MHRPVTGGPLGFAHRGARADAPENTLEAFQLALALGATGLESDVWLTADGLPALHHGAKIDGIPVGELRAGQLPPYVPLLGDLYAACGTGFDLSLDLKDGRSAEAVLLTARAAGHDVTRLWLCGRGTSLLPWRALSPEVRLVSDTRPPHVRGAGGWAPYLAGLRAGHVDAVNLRRRKWTAPLVAQVHRAGLLAFGWDAQTTRRLQALLALGCDAVYSDHVRRLVPVLQAGAGPGPVG